MSAIKRPNDMLKGKRNEILAVLYKLHSRGGRGAEHLGFRRRNEGSGYAHGVQWLETVFSSTW